MCEKHSKIKDLKGIIHFCKQKCASHNNSLYDLYNDREGIRKRVTFGDISKENQSSK